MKKTMIIALLAVLVLGVFTACNGDVNADLSGGKRVIYLEISEDSVYLSFDGNGSKTMTVEVPSGCKNWGDLAEDGLTITIYNSHTPGVGFEATLKKSNEGNQVHFYDENGSVPFFSIKPAPKAIDYNSIGCNVEIINKATYLIVFLNEG